MQNRKQPTVHLFVMILLLGFAGCSSENKAEKNRAYIRKMFDDVVWYYEKYSEIPSPYDAVIERGGSISHRGDYFGRAFMYRSVGTNMLMLRSVGPNGKNENGRGDDYELFYADGKIMEYCEFTEWFANNIDPWSIVGAKIMAYHGNMNYMQDLISNCGNKPEAGTILLDHDPTVDTNRKIWLNWQ